MLLEFLARALEISQAARARERGRSLQRRWTCKVPASAIKTSNTANVNISVEQQTEIRQVVKEVHVAPVKETDFTVSVGTAIQKKVRLATLPPRIVKIVPEYKGYRYFAVAEGRIVIVDPDSLEIVFIVTA